MRLARHVAGELPDGGPIERDRLGAHRRHQPDTSGWDRERQGGRGLQKASTIQGASSSREEVTLENSVDAGMFLGRNRALEAATIDPCLSHWLG